MGRRRILTAREQVAMTAPWNVTGQAGEMLRRTAAPERHPDLEESLRLHGVVHTTGGRRLPGRHLAVADQRTQETRLLDARGWQRHPSFTPSGLAVQGASAYAGLVGLEDPHAHDYGAVEQRPQTVRTVGRLYDALPGHDPGAVRHFDAMRREVANQHDFMTGRLGIRTEVVDHDPYSDVHEMMADINGHKRLKVLGTRATGSHPHFSDDENDMFRAVHDFFGHAATGRSFDRHGEQAAYLAHSRMFSPDARPAMTTETKGQNSSLILNGHFAPQKVGILPAEHWDDRALRLAFMRKHAASVDLKWERDGSGDWILIGRNPDGNPVAIATDRAPSVRTSRRLAMPAEDAYDSDQADRDPQPVSATGPWYHGSSHDIPEGTILTPGEAKEKSTRGDIYTKPGWDGRQNWIWMHSDPYEAHLYPTMPGDYLYELEPLDEGPHAWNGDEGEKSWGYVSPRARVVRKIDPSDWRKTYDDYYNRNWQSKPGMAYMGEDMRLPYWWRAQQEERDYQRRMKQRQRKYRAQRTASSVHVDYADAPRDEKGRVLLHRGVDPGFNQITFHNTPDPTGETQNSFHFTPPEHWDEAMNNIRSENPRGEEGYGSYWGTLSEARGYADDVNDRQPHGAMTVSAWWHPDDIEDTEHWQDGVWVKPGAQGEVVQSHVYRKGQGWVPLPGSVGRTVTAGRTAGNGGAERGGDYDNWEEYDPHPEDWIDDYPLENEKEEQYLRRIYEPYPADSPDLPDHLKPHTHLPIDVVHHYREFDRPYDANTRMVQRVIADQGIRQPLKISTDGTHAMLIEGNHRLHAARQLGMTHLPVQVFLEKPGEVMGKKHPDMLATHPDYHDPAPLEPVLSDWIKDNGHTLRSFWD